MKLSLEEIKSITNGALRITEEANGIHFYRCTEKQTATWLTHRQDLAERSVHTAGIRLDFYTNSKSLSFVAPSGDKFEVSINGLLHTRIEADKCRETGEFPTIPLTDPYGEALEECRVTLWLPSHSVGVLESVTLDDGATLRPYTEYGMKILFIGDSITQGWNSYYDSLSYANRVAAHYNASYVNQGIGGAYYHEDCFDSIDFDPDVVTVAYGTNDFAVFPTYDEFRSHVRAHLTLIANEYEGKKIFVITPIWRGRHLKTKMGVFSEACAIVKKEAERLGLTVIDGSALVPPVPALFTDAWLHPNDLGFSLYAENLIRALDPFLKS